MNIHLYLEDDTEIVSFYDMTSNPFKLGDVLRYRAWRRWACRMLNFSRMCLPTFAKPVLYEVPTYLR